jgi:predicted MFS family arabinose efflux permease
VAIELSPAGLRGAIAADLDNSVVAVGTMTTFYALGTPSSSSRSRPWLSASPAEPR